MTASLVFLNRTRLKKKIHLAALGCNKIEEITKYEKKTIKQVPA